MIKLKDSCGYLTGHGVLAILEGLKSVSKVRTTEYGITFRFKDTVCHILPVKFVGDGNGDGTFGYESVKNIMDSSEMSVCFPDFATMTKGGDRINGIPQCVHLKYDNDRFRIFKGSGSPVRIGNEHAVQYMR